MSDLTITEFEIAISNGGPMAIRVEFPVPIRTVPKRPTIAVENNKLVICRRRNERVILEGVLPEHLSAVQERDVIYVFETASEGSTSEVEYKAAVID